MSFVRNPFLVGDFKLQVFIFKFVSFSSIVMNK